MDPKRDAPSIKIISWNANGIYRDLVELKLLVKDRSPDLILIQESKLNKRKPPALFGYKPFQTYQQPDKGLLTYVKITLNTQFSMNNANINSLQTSIGDTTITNIHNTKTLKSDELEKLLGSKPKHAVIGDFNAHHKTWNCHRNNTSGIAIRNLADKRGNIQIAFPTNSHTHYPYSDRKPSTIDLALAKGVYVSSIETINALNSDHLPLEITLQTTNSIPLRTANFKLSTDFPAYKKLLQETLTLTPNIQSTEQLNAVIRSFTNHINKAIQKCSKRLKPTPFNVPIDDDIKALIRYKNTLRRHQQKSFTKTLKEEINTINGQIKTKIRAVKERFWMNEISRIKPDNKHLWALARRLKSTKTNNQIPPLHTANKGIVLNDTQKAEALADTFHQKHLLSNHLSNPTFSGKISRQAAQIVSKIVTTPSEDLVHMAEIKDILKRLKNRKAPGTDGISNLHIKNLPPKGLTQLLYILRACLKLQHFPECWKEAAVIPIQKPDKDPVFPENYRPISLLPSFSKILEYVILARINSYLSTNKIIPEQHGFRNSHSTITQLCRILSHIIINNNQNKIAALVSLDIEAAFDTVWHEALIVKLHKIGIPTHLNKMIHSYLSDRSFRVKVSQSKSHNQNIPAGVPQGGVLSPILFNVFINDLLPKVHNEDIKAALFADDAAFLATESNKNFLNTKLQLYLDEVSKFYNKWKIKINTSKSQIIYFGPARKSRIKIKMNGNVIPEVKSLKYLGLNIDRRLNFHQHINERIAKYKRAYSAYFKLINGSIGKRAKITLYKCGLRPILTYGSPVWSNINKEDQKRLQTIQNKFLRQALVRKRRTPIHDLHELANIPTMDQWLATQSLNFYQRVPRVSSELKDLLETSPVSVGTRKTYKMPHQSFSGRSGNP